MGDMKVKKIEILGHVIGMDHRCYQHLERKEIVGSQCGFLEEVVIELCLQDLWHLKRQQSRKEASQGEEQPGKGGRRVSHRKACISAKKRTGSERTPETIC